MFPVAIHQTKQYLAIKKNNDNILMNKKLLKIYPMFQVN